MRPRRARWLPYLVLMMLVWACTSGGEDAGRERGRRRPPTTRQAQPAAQCDPHAEPVGSGFLDIEEVAFGETSEREDRVVASVGQLDVIVDLDPFAMRVDRSGEPVVQTVPLGGLRLQRGDAPPATVTQATFDSAARCAVELDVSFTDGTTAALELAALGPDTVAATLSFGDPTGITAWGQDLMTPPDERIYGLTTRIVTDPSASEFFPEEVGSLDRKGEVVEMYVRPTIAGYVPFHHSSEGYGLLVDGTMPGSYDIGASQPEVLSMDFELDPQAGAARWFVFGAADHYGLNDAFTRLAGRPIRPPRTALLHTRGRDVLDPGPPVEVDGVAMNPTVADDLLSYERHDIPPGIYHFDRPWAAGTEGFGQLRFDPERFPNAAGMLRVMVDRGWTPQVWFSEWALGERGEEARENGWLVADSEREIDLTNRDALRWLQDDVRAFLDGPEGRYVRGFFLDRTDEIVPSDSEDRYDDGRNGRQMHNAYPVLMQRVLHTTLEAARGEDSWIIARAGYTGTPEVAISWGGDTRSREGAIVPEQPDVGPSTDLGLRSVLISMQRAAFMGMPFWGSDIGGYSEFGDREVFARWLEVGALSPLMRVHGKGTKAPWDMPTEPHLDREVLDIYRRYVGLHHALVPTLEDLADEAHATGAPLVRPLVFNYPNDPQVADLWDQWLLGDDLIVAPVWRSGDRRRDVYLPEGRWVDFWDRDRIVQGPITLDEHAPLDELPMFAREGSEILRVSPPR